ncbi:ribonuclease H-like domain-containing protein [Lysobacter enzymogenes]|uniref:ribonuclease H-like domain-containing protein n=1 Tax=Lysobacter enzymogenes TaxID=69 RepID=UPI001A9752E5|nr:ribonuclease H-like domain-containing protein [Lysobacter enzymogenes]QQP95026.1 ribonuclease H-like domain-containing protein [Lysobacter enzymogenes]
MSLNLARLRALQQQAGRSETAAPRAAAPVALPATRDEPAATNNAALVQAATPGAAGTDSAGAAAAAANARSDADCIFGPDGLAPAPARTQRPDLDALRRMIALRERKPTPASGPPAPRAADARGDARESGRSAAALARRGERASAADPARSVRALPADRSLPGEEIAPGLHLIQAHLPLPGPREALPLDFAKRREDRLDPRRLLFFDTETTGLAGGTGTRAFMIGAADWYDDPQRGDGLRIRQLMISTLSAETAMLREFARWLTAETVLSSYNGRCYDAPLLNTRYRLARIANPLAGLDHVDLLFPTRRLYRGVWENCKLATMERELLRIVREDDLPGSQAPAAWLHFLRGGSSALLRRVAAHNHQDVVTLAQLMLRLVQAQAQADAALLES